MTENAFRAYPLTTPNHVAVTEQDAYEMGNESLYGTLSDLYHDRATVETSDDLSAEYSEMYLDYINTSIRNAEREVAKRIEQGSKYC